MSVQTEIDRINGNIAAAYTAAEELGADLPAKQNSGNLPETIRAIPTAEIVQETGSSETAIMSQAAVTRELNKQSEDIANKTSNVSNLGSRVSVLEKSSGGSVIPAYVVTEAEAVAEKVLAVRNAKSFVFGGTSDLHTIGTEAGILHAGQGMDIINSITRIDSALFFGDIILDRFTNTYKDGFKYVRSCFYELFKDTDEIFMQGNHDEYSADTTAQGKQKYFAYIGANNKGTVTDFNNRYGNYGYKDFDDQRFRLIYLNSADVSAGEITDDCYITGQQFSWLVNTALNFSNKENPETWHFIVCCHHPLNWFGTSMANLLTILDSYKGGKSGSITWDGVSIPYNFTSSTRPKFVAHFHGHLHNFRTEMLGSNGVLSITIPNACATRNNEYGTYSGYTDDVRAKYGDTDANGNQRQFNKTSETANDTAFNVVVIDMENEEIHAFCYGAGVDRKITFDGVLTETGKGDPVIPDVPDEPDTPTPAYTNQIPLSVNADGTEFVGENGEDGYKVGYRLSTSSGNESAQAGISVTGYIPIPEKATIYIKDMTFSSNTSTYCVYDLSLAKQTAGYCNTTFTQDATGVWSKTFGNNEGYIRISGEFGENPIVTVNEEITD